MRNSGLYNKRSSRRDVEDGAVLSRRDPDAPDFFYYVTKSCHHVTLKMGAEDSRPSAPIDAPPRQPRPLDTQSSVFPERIGETFDFLAGFEKIKRRNYIDIMGL
jgi:hypothetical protein